jgi:hypothetical protein
MHALPSNGVLAHVATPLAELGFAVEAGKKHVDKIRVPVLYGNNGRVAKSFEADAYHAGGGFVVEVEAGRGVANNQFLKDLFQACMMDDVEYRRIQPVDATPKICVSSGGVANEAATENLLL